MQLRRACLVAILFSVPTIALADSYPVSGGTPAFSGSGTLTVTALSGDTYQITGIQGSGVTGLLGSVPGRTVDNTLYPSQDSADGAYLDSNGFAFSDQQGDTIYDVNLFANPGGTYQAYLLDNDGYTQTVDVDFTLGPDSPNAMFRQLAALQPGQNQSFGYSFATTSAAATPEPSPVALLGTGFLGIAGLLHRKRS